MTITYALFTPRPLDFFCCNRREGLLQCRIIGLYKHAIGYHGRPFLWLQDKDERVFVCLQQQHD